MTELFKNYLDNEIADIQSGISDSRASFFNTAPFVVPSNGQITMPLTLDVSAGSDISLDQDGETIHCTDGTYLVQVAGTGSGVGDATGLRVIITASSVLGSDGQPIGFFAIPIDGTACFAWLHFTGGTGTVSALFQARGGTTGATVNGGIDIVKIV